MKKTTLYFVVSAFALAGSIFILPSCNKGTTNNTEKTMALTNGNLSFEIPVFSANGEFDSITAFNYKINMDSFVKSFDSKYDTSSIRMVQLRSCSLTMTDGNAGSNFQNFHTVNMGVTSGTNKKIYRLAAAINIVDTPAYFLDVPKTYNANLASYFKADSICYRLYGNIRRTSAGPVNCKAIFTYDIILSK